MTQRSSRSYGRSGSLLNERNGSGRDYTIFSDAQAAIAWVQHDRCGLALARAVIAMTDDLYSRDNTLRIRWAPSHEGVEGNEQADRAAKSAAEGEEERAEPGYIQEASLSHLMQKTAEEPTEATRERVRKREAPDKAPPVC